MKCEVCGRLDTDEVLQIDHDFYKINNDMISVYIKHEIDENGRIKETRYYGEFCPRCGKIIENV